MPRIKLTTEIEADIHVVFDLSRSIDLHKISAAKTNEKAIDGKVSGLIGLNESVTWKARHFGVYQRLTSKVTEFDRPNHFVDEQESGIFKFFRHEHHFRSTDQGTEMIDIFDYRSPCGILGNFADRLFLKRYMTTFLEKRNKVIKEFAESEKWKTILTTNT